MQRRSVVALVVGFTAVACASGVIETVPRSPPISKPVELPRGDSPAVFGRVSDASTGEPIVGALVLLGCSCLAEPREITTNADGVYSFSDLPPGKYGVQVLSGHANQTRTIQLAADRSFRINFSIDPGQRYVIT